MRITTVLTSIFLTIGLGFATLVGLSIAIAEEATGIVTRAEAALWGTGVDADPVRGQALLNQRVSRGDLLSMRMLGEQLIGG